MSSVWTTGSLHVTGSLPAGLFVQVTKPLISLPAVTHCALRADLVKLSQFIVCAGGQLGSHSSSDPALSIWDCGAVKLEIEGQISELWHIYHLKFPIWLRSQFTLRDLHNISWFGHETITHLLALSSLFDGEVWSQYLLFSKLQAQILQVMILVHVLLLYWKSIHLHLKTAFARLPASLTTKFCRKFVVMSFSNQFGQTAVFVPLQKYWIVFLKDKTDHLTRKIIGWPLI